jgi:hypothetical protein
MSGVTIEVSGAAAMAEAIRLHAGTEATIRWGTFVVTFRELAGFEKRTEQVWAVGTSNSQNAGRLGWWGTWTAEARGASSRARRRNAFEGEREDMAHAVERLPKSAWPK